MPSASETGLQLVEQLDLLSDQFTSFVAANEDFEDRFSGRVEELDRTRVASHERPHYESNVLAVLSFYMTTDRAVAVNVEVSPTDSTERKLPLALNHEI